MQPLQYDLQLSAAKDNSIASTAAAPSNLDAAITMRFADTELQNTKELRATASEIAAPKPDLDAQAKKRQFCSTFEKDLKKINRKITSAKVEKICWRITVAALMQPLECFSQHHVANLISLHTWQATPVDNNHAAIPMRSATTDSKKAA